MTEEKEISENNVDVESETEAASADKTTTETPAGTEVDAEASYEERMKALEDAEAAFDAAFATNKASRADITYIARESVETALERVNVAMEADAEVDEAVHLGILAEKTGNRENTKLARKRERVARKKAKQEHKAATKSAKRAYDAIKFTQPNKMGFMRAVQVFFALHIATYLIYLILTSRDAMTYSGATVVDWIMVIVEGVAFWLFINRYKVGRYVVMGMAAFGIVASIISSIVAGNFNPFATMFNEWFYVFLLLYFWLSKRVKAVLVNDLAMHKGAYDKEEFVIQRRGWPFVRNLIIYFIVFSVLGHWMEMAMCQLIIAGVVQGEYDPTNTLLWRDWLYPFPMEGAAVVIIAVFLYPLFIWMKKKFTNPILPYVVSFITNALMCTVIEFSMGLIVNADLQMWDYTDNFCNIMGQVCLQNTMAFGVAASLIAWFVYPMLERWIARVPYDIMNIVFVVVLVFGGIIWSLYIIEPPAELEEANTAAEMAQEDRPSEEALRLGLMAMDIESMESDIEKMPEQTQEAMRAQIEEMRAVLEAEMKAAGIEELPSNEDVFAYLILDDAA